MVTPDDPRMNFAAAERAFASGRLDEARRLLERVLVSLPSDAAALHLLALTEKRAGRTGAARAAFALARAAAPHDAAIVGNEANLLDMLGESEAALAGYDAALRIAPDFADARYNKALLLQRQDRIEDALAELDRMLEYAPAARVHSARGTVLARLGRPAEAARAFDSALALEPDRPIALHGRARAAMETGDPSAPDRFERALQRSPGDPDLVLGLAESIHAEGDPYGAALLTQVLEARPEWAQGHEALALMRSEGSTVGDPTDHYRPALARFPENRALHMSYWQTLLRGERYAEALTAIDASRTRFAADPGVALIEALAAAAIGDSARAERLLAALPPDADVAVARGRVALRAGEPERAARLLQDAAIAAPQAIAVWAWLGLTWRLLDDPRAAWLYGQPGSIASVELPLGDTEIAELTTLLRSLHRMRAHPIGQSLRGGTQTRGRLFWRPEPQLARLQDALLTAVRAHVAALPPADPTHPLLRHRDDPVTLGGSWSVRLSGGGYHIGHIHPEGILSSACYIALPAGTDRGADPRAGWLELGAAPAGSGLEIPPLAVIEPVQGRLALFPSYVFHSTRAFAGGERLTVAFDVVKPGI